MEDQPTTATTTTPSSPRKPQPNSTSILHKALFIVIFLLLIPLFPSEAPEFLNQTPLTRSWELIHLLLVGIAVSYGLCSRRNVSSESIHKTHMTLQVATVFDDDDEETESNDTHVWNSRYHRGEPKVMVEGEGHDSNRPLCLPVRSLRSQVGNDDDGYSDSKMKKEEERTSSSAQPSPIPWRSRSARMESKIESLSPAAPSLSPSMHRNEHQPPKVQSLRTRKISSSSLKISPPPPPPPPPPPLSRSLPPSRRSLYPSESFQKKQMSMDESGGGEQSKGESFLQPPTFALKTHEEKVSKKAKRRNGSSRKFIIDSDDDGESVESSSDGDASSSVTEVEEVDGNEVDKKADEFIAKFREQIRLQRIEHIKRSTVQNKRLV